MRAKSVRKSVISISKSLPKAWGAELRDFLVLLFESRIDLLFHF